MNDLNYRIQIYPDTDNNKNNSISMLFSSIEELNSAENMAINLLTYLQDDLRIMKGRSNVFIAYEFNVDSQEWEEIGYEQ